MHQLKKLSLALALVVLFMTGCAKNQQAISNVSSENANALNAQHSKFEKSEDPPFTVQTHFAAGQLAESQEAPLAAIAHYQDALRVDPHHRDSLFRVGVLYTKLKEYP